MQEKIVFADRFVFLPAQLPSQYQRLILFSDPSTPRLVHCA